MSSENMKTCANCGNEVREGARFCASCGAAVAPPAAEPPRVEPSPPPSAGGKRRLLWIAVGAAVVLLVAGGAVAATLSLTSGDDASEATPTEFATDSTTSTTETDFFGDTTETTVTSVDVGQGVDQTCEDLLAFFVLAKDVDIARGGDSVGDVEQVQAAVYDLASKAPSDSQGEPRDSLEAIAVAYGTYLSVLSEQGLEPGPDALLEPTVASAWDDLSLQFSLGVAPWMDESCSPELLAQAQEVLGTG